MPLLKRQKKDREELRGGNMGESVEHSEMKSVHKQVLIKVNCLRDVKEKETLMPPE